MYVSREGPERAEIMLVGEAPGEEEDRTGRNFIGASGQELDALLRRASIVRAECAITNVVKMRPTTASGDNRTPTETEVREWLPVLRGDVEAVKPTVVAAVGRIAARVFLGDVDMHSHHGIAWKCDLSVGGGDWCDWNGVVVPCYHPASSFRNPKNAAMSAEDFACVRRVVDGEESVYDLHGLSREGEYGWLTNEVVLDDRPEAIAMDTEYRPDKSAIFVQLSVREGTGYVVRASDVEQLERLREYVRGRLVVVHNAMADLPVFEQLGLCPEQMMLTDTMVMAYLLGIEPQGLKQLAARHALMEMMGYLDVTRSAQDRMASEWLERVSQQWCEEVVVLRGKSGRLLKTPRKISLLPKGKRGFWSLYTQRTERNNEARMEDGEQRSELFEWWKGTALCSKGAIEQAFGPMPVATLEDVDESTALWYSGRDPDATLRVWHVLDQKIRHERLEDVLDRDMRMIPLVVQMEQNGIAVDVGKLQELGDTMITPRMEEIIELIRADTGVELNPNSPKQVAELLYDMQVFDTLDQSTAAESLDALIDSDPVVGLIKEWRALAKLNGTYVEGLQKHVEGDRIHTTFRVTRVDTGRLASCIPGHVEVYTETGNVPIEDVEVGTRVWTHRGEWREVIGKFDNGVQPVYRVTLDNGQWVECTSNHRLYTKRGWLSIDDMRDTRVGRHTDGFPLFEWSSYGVACYVREWGDRRVSPIKSVKPVGTARVYDLEVDADHCFVANGIFVHNSSPNLMNIPSRSELGRKIRGAFVAPSGTKLVAVDLSQIELRVLAHESQDQVMMDVFGRNGDMHAEMAARMFGIPLEEVDDLKHRKPAKKLNFGVVYGITAHGVARQYAAERIEGWTMEGLEQMIRDWYRVCSGVGEYHQKIRREALETGRVRDMFGRYRLTPGASSALRWVREKTLREAVNAPIQSGAQGVVKEAMGQLVPIVRQWQFEGKHVLPLLQIHDELVFEVGDPWVEEVKEVVVRVMENAVALDVPVLADSAVGETWADV